MKGRKTWKWVLGLIGISVGLPYAVTLALHRQPVNSEIEEFYSGKTVVCTDGTVLDGEEYLVGVTAAQIPVSYGTEAVKAQAVLARTKLYSKFGEADRIEEEELGLSCYTLAEMEQVWGKSHLETYYSLVRQAVSETQGETLQYEGTYIEPLYHLASGGTTRADSSGYFPYLTAVDSSRDLELSGSTQAVIMTEAEFARALSAQNKERQIDGEGLLESIQVIEKDSSGYVNKMMIGGSEFTGVEVAAAAGVSSCCFSIGSYGTGENGEQELQIVAYGIGHGYGMSQYGASKCAEEGMDYRQILDYYFPGTTLAAENLSR